MADANGQLVVTGLAELKGRNRQNIKLPESGTVVTIRKLVGIDYLGMGNLPPVILNETNDEKRRELAKDMWKDSKQQEALMFNIVCRGVVSHKVVQCHPKDCPPDAVTIDQLGQGNDVFWLATQIQTFSGLDQEAAQVPATFPSAAPAGPST